MNDNETVRNIDSLSVIHLNHCEFRETKNVLFLLEDSQVAAHILPVGDPAMLITVNFFLWKCILYG